MPRRIKDSDEYTNPVYPENIADGMGGAAGLVLARGFLGRNF